MRKDEFLHQRIPHIKADVEITAQLFTPFIYLSLACTEACCPCVHTYSPGPSASWLPKASWWGWSSWHGVVWDSGSMFKASHHGGHWGVRSCSRCPEATPQPGRDGVRCSSPGAPAALLLRGLLRGEGWGLPGGVWGKRGRGRPPAAGSVTGARSPLGGFPSAPAGPYKRRRGERGAERGAAPPGWSHAARHDDVLQQVLGAEGLLSGLGPAGGAPRRPHRKWRGWERSGGGIRR